MEKEEILKEYGLTEKEIKIYLTLLSLGNVNLQEISKRVDIPRTTVYNTLTYLHQKGLISKIIKKGVTFYEASDPKKLLDNLKEKAKLMETILPELESLKELKKSSSGVEIYQGFKGISTILSDIFKVKQQIYYFGSYSKSVEILKHLPEHYRTIRLDNKIPAKIVIDPFDEETFHRTTYKKITEMRFLKLLKDFPCMIFIYGDKVAIYTVEGDLIGIIIKNKEVALAMKLVFEMYWKTARP